MSYAIGAQVPLPYVVRDGSGALVDAAAVSVVVTAPDGSTTTLTLAGGGVVRQSAGTYLALFAAAQAGRHTWVGTSTGPATALEPDAFNVTSASDAPIVGLADARGWLDIARPDFDPLIRRSLNRATEIAEWWTGETIRRTTVVETRDGSVRAIRLRERPVVSMTSVVEQGVALSVTPGIDWTLDANAGVIYRGASTAGSALWAWGINAVTFTYVAGYTVIPDRYLGAVEELTRTVFAGITEGDSDDAVDERNNPTVRRLCALHLGPRRSALG